MRAQPDQDNAFASTHRGIDTKNVMIHTFLLLVRGALQLLPVRVLGRHGAAANA